MKKYLITYINFVIVIMLFPLNSLIEVSALTENVSNLNPTNSTYEFLKLTEGYSSECFWDYSQWSIGYGNKCPHTHTANGTYYKQPGGHSITEEAAIALLNQKLPWYVDRLKSNCAGLTMNQNQFDALLSATYNHGNVSACPLKYYLQGNLTESEAREKYYVWYINPGTSSEAGLSITVVKNEI